MTYNAGEYRMPEWRRAKEWHELRAALTAAYTALERYGRHDDTCLVQSAMLDLAGKVERSRCSCGYGSALAAIRETLGEGQ